MRAIFMGTPELAVASLEALVEVCRARGGDVVGVVCQPDRPAGRGMQLSEPPVKVRAKALGLEVIQPTKVRDGALERWIREKAADVALVIAYGRILPKGVLEAPRRGCVNLHASILPKYRGAAPIAWAIANDEPETGVALMQMDEGLDTGPVYAVRRLAIGPDETTPELSKRIAALAAELVREALADVVEGKVAPVAQDHAAHTVARILAKEDGVIDFQKPARAIHAHVRAMTPWPAAVTRLPDGKSLKVLRTRPIATTIASPVARVPGAVLLADRSGVVVACGASGEEAIAILEAQPEGRKAASAGDLVNGRVIAAGVRLGVAR
jgi:methionyl-tRNA formyltransferase